MYLRFGCNQPNLNNWNMYKGKRSREPMVPASHIWRWLQGKWRGAWILKGWVARELMRKVVFRTLNFQSLWVSSLELHLSPLFFWSTELYQTWHVPNFPFSSPTLFLIIIFISCQSIFSNKLNLFCPQALLSKILFIQFLHSSLHRPCSKALLRNFNSLPSPSVSTFSVLSIALSFSWKLISLFA